MGEFKGARRENGAKKEIKNSFFMHRQLMQEPDGRGMGEET